MQDILIEDENSTELPKTAHCIRCEKEFLFRANKKFCSSNCRRRHSEPQQNSFFSPIKWRNNMELFDRASRIAEIYFNLPPPKRDGFMAELISSARSGQDKRLRDILSNKILLDPTNNWGNPFRGKRGKSCGSIATAAKSYCWTYWNASVKDVIHGRVPEPGEGIRSKKRPTI